MKKCFTTLLFAVTIAVNAQDLTFNNIHKLVDAKKYREAISELRTFVKTEPKHVSAHYDLATSYWGLLSGLATIQNANVRNQDVSQWSDKEYQENLNYWKCGINYTDSAIYYYKETSELMNLRFLELDLRYPEFQEAIKNCNMLSMVKCARNYIADQVTILDKVNADNKSNLFNVQKNYEVFQKNNQSNQATNNAASNSPTNIDYPNAIYVIQFAGANTKSLGIYKDPTKNIYTGLYEEHLNGNYKKVILQDIQVNQQDHTFSFMFNGQKCIGIYTQTYIKILSGPLLEDGMEWDKIDG